MDLKAFMMSYDDYSVIIEEDDEGNGFSAWIEELEGCHTCDDTYEKTKSRIKDVAESWVMAEIGQGHNIPMPFSKQGISGNIQVEISKGLHFKLVEAVKNSGLDFNQYMEEAIRQRLVMRSIGLVSGNPFRKPIV